MSRLPHARPRVVVSHWVHPEVLAALGEFCDPEAPDAPGEVWDAAALRERSRDADALIACMANRVDAAFLEHCPRLVIVAATLKGYDNFDAAACAERGVWLTIVPEAIVEATAELAIGLTIALLRRVAEGDRELRRSRYPGWRPTLYGATLRGSRVGILGMGELGRAIAAMLRPFGAVVSYSDPRPLDAAAEASLAVRPRSLEALVESSDVLMVALALTPDTRGLLNRELISRLPAGAAVINVGRGSTLDEAAVAEALSSGHLGGYGADVHACEDWGLADRPVEISRLLREHPRTVLTPHLGSAVDAVRREMSLISVGQVRQALAGEVPDHAVNQPGIH